MNKRFASCVLGLIFATASCVQNDGTRWTPLESFELMSLDDERQLGMDFDRELEEHFRLIRDPVVMGFLYDLGQQIVASVEPQPFVYRFQIVEAPQLNAFAVPGGYIYFHSGTLLAATTVDELAAVMAHEVAHVNKRHLAHRRQDRQIPSLLAQTALIFASVASQNAAPLITGMAINVAVDLHYSRTDEAEADRLGAVYASRAGFDPAHGARFFQRILDQQARLPDTIPPYLFSHPEIGERIRVVAQQAKSLTPTRAPAPGTAERFETMQARLALLIDQKRTELPGDGFSGDHSRNDVELARIESLIAEGRNEEALSALATLSVVAPQDPRVPFRVGELLQDANRIDGAVAAYRRTLELDAPRALVFYKLGLAYRDRGDRLRAVYALEQAMKRGKGSLSERARWEVVKLTFGVIADAGFGTPQPSQDGSDFRGTPVTEYGADESELAWWGRVSGPVLARKDDIRVRWRGPDGRVTKRTRPENAGRLYLAARHPLPEQRFGDWTLEVILDDHVAHRSRVRVSAPGLGPD